MNRLKTKRNVLITLLISMIFSTFTTKIEANESKNEKEQRPKKELIEPEAIKLECNGQKYFAYTPENAKIIVMMIEHYHLLWSYSLSLEKDIVSYELELTTVYNEVFMWKELTMRSDERGDLYLGMYKKTNEKLLKLQDKSKYKWIPWTLAAIEAIAFGIYAGVKH